MLFKPGSAQEREIIGPRRPPTRPRSGVAELGEKLDRLAALVESVPEQPDAVAPVNAVEPDLSPEALAKMSADEFRAMSALRWSQTFGHLAGGSPYSRAYGTPAPLAPFRTDGS